MAFCKACNQKVEWYPSVDGKDLCIEPDPKPEGNLKFDKRMKLEFAPVGSTKRMYVLHINVCAKADLLRRQIGASKAPCDKWEGCTRTDRHLHCFNCGSTEHLAGDCDESE